MFKKIEVLPDRLYIDENYSLKHPKKSDYICVIGNGFILVNKRCADFLQQFRLGETTFTPVQIHKLSTDELLLEETFYFLNICERREYINETQTYKHLETLDPAFQGRIIYRMSARNLKNDVIEVSSESLGCDVDLWHDPRLCKSLFLSDELHTALKKEGLADLWIMHSCQINETQA